MTDKNIHHFTSQIFRSQLIMYNLYPMLIFPKNKIPLSFDYQSYKTKMFTMFLINTMIKQKRTATKIF